MITAAWPAGIHAVTHTALVFEALHPALCTPPTPAPCPPALLPAFPPHCRPLLPGPAQDLSINTILTKRMGTPGFMPMDTVLDGIPGEHYPKSVDMPALGTMLFHYRYLFRPSPFQTLTPTDLRVLLDPSKHGTLRFWWRPDDDMAMTFQTMNVSGVMRCLGTGWLLG